MRMRRNEGKREKILAKERFTVGVSKVIKSLGRQAEKGTLKLKQWSRHIERNPSVPTLN